MCILHLHGRPLRDAKAILAAFSNAFNKHMLACEFHCGSLSLVSTLCISYTLLFILCQQFYLSFEKKVLLFLIVFAVLLFENLDTIIY